MVSIMRDRITATTDTPRRTNSRSVWTLWCLLLTASFCISKASFSWKKTNNKSTITISLWLYFTTTTKILQFFMRQSIWKIWGHKTLRYLTLTQELEGGLRSKKVAPITAMIIFHIILHPAVRIFDFHIFITLDPNSSFSSLFQNIHDIKKGVQNLPMRTPISLGLHKGQRQLFPIINNYSPSPNGLWVNSPWGRRPNGLLTQRPWGREE